MELAFGFYGERFAVDTVGRANTSAVDRSSIFLSPLIPLYPKCASHRSETVWMSRNSRELVFLLQRSPFSTPGKRVEDVLLIDVTTAHLFHLFTHIHPEG